MTLKLDVPPDVEREKLVTAAVALYGAGMLTQGQAAEMGGLSRVEFFDELGRRGVTPFQYDPDDRDWADTPEAAETADERRAAG